MDVVLCSFDEMALYDLPTMIGYVVSTAGVKTLSYIGHSQVLYS
jgi:hypothetical protein